MAAGRVLVAMHQEAWVVKMVGDVRMTLCNTIDYCLQKMFDDSKFQTVIVDLTETEGIDSTSLGLLAKLSIRTKQRLHKVPTIVSTTKSTAARPHPPAMATASSAARAIGKVHMGIFLAGRPA